MTDAIPSRAAQFRARSRGFYGVGAWHPKKGVNVGTLWRSAALYEANFVFTVGARYDHRQPGDTMKVPRHTPLIHHSDIHDLVDHLPHGCRLVGIELDPRAIDLAEYHHPERCAYLLGAEDTGLSEDVLALCTDVVQIPCPAPWSMNVACAGAIVLTDRYVKARPSAPGRFLDTAPAPTHVTMRDTA